MSLPLLELLAESETLDDAAIDRFLAANPAPIVRGTSVTFLYRGTADAVYLRHFIYGLPSAQPFQRVGDTDLWHFELELPRESRVEYKLIVEFEGREAMIRDPLNPLLAHDPFGANSVCHGAGYEAPAWAEHDPEARTGLVERHQIASEAYGEDREVALYLPARLRGTRRYPLLIVLDGEDYLRYASLQTVLDNLIHAGEIAPMVVAMVQSPNRMEEYAAHEDQARFLADELVPWVERHLPIRERAAYRGILGASLGAVAALHTACLRPGRFGRLLLQSGAFAFTDIGRQVRSPILEPVRDFVNPFREDPGRPSDRVYVTCGVYERLIYENRALVPVLQETGMDVRYVETRDGHNWENWRDRLREALAWLFPGPLRLMYE